MFGLAHAGGDGDWGALLDSCLARLGDATGATIGFVYATDAFATGRSLLNEKVTSQRPSARGFAVTDGGSFAAESLGTRATATFGGKGGAARDGFARATATRVRKPRNDGENRACFIGVT